MRPTLLPWKMVANQSRRPLRKVIRIAAQGSRVLGETRGGSRLKWTANLALRRSEFVWVAAVMAQLSLWGDRMAEPRVRLLVVPDGRARCGECPPPRDSRSSRRHHEVHGFARESFGGRSLDHGRRPKGITSRPYRGKLE